MILHGDSLEILKTFEANSIDSIVTDPPYGLKFMGKKWDYQVPSIELWKEALRVLKPGGHLLSFGGTRTYHRMVVNIEDAAFEIRDCIQWLYGSGFPKSHNLPGGFGSALKPANEPIVMARKPLEAKLTIAQNVLKYGTGALNIDASRIDFANEKDAKEGRSARPSKSKGMEFFTEAGHDQFDRSNRDQIQGRWPANIILDEEAAQALDEQAPEVGGGGPGNRQVNRRKGSSSFDVGVKKPELANQFAGPKGGASRFFYVAKASKSERNKGLEGMPSKVISVWGGDEDDLSDGKKSTLPRENHHPTVKPVKLMEYLVRLVTPPNGTVLDPFMGSGTTGVACKNLGFKFVGIELNEEYVAIAERRMVDKQLELA